MANSTPAEVLTGAYSAFGAGDMEALGGFLADNVFWQIGGTGPLDGDYQGREAVFGFLAALAERSGGTFSIEVTTLMGNDTHASALLRETGTREGRQLDATVVHFVAVADGQITGFLASSSDPAVHAFWAD